MMNNIIQLSLIKRYNKPTLQIIKNANDNLVFEYVVLATGFGIHCSNNFLRSLNTGLEVKFESFIQYDELINNVSKTLKTTREEL